MFKFRNKAKINAGFGLILMTALRSAASRSTARRVGRKQFFLFDNDDSLQSFASALFGAQREWRVFQPQFDELQWALGQAKALLLVRSGDELHYLCSDDPEEFEELLSRPGRLRGILRNFRGVNSQYRWGNLAAVPA